MAHPFFKIAALTLTASLFAGSAFAGEAEKNVARFVGSAVLAGGATYALEDEEHRALYGAAIGALPSVAKEIADTSTKHGASGQDLCIGFAGAALGAYLADEALTPKDVAPVVVGSIAGPVAGTLAAAALNDKPLVREDVPGLALGVVAAAVGGWPVVALHTAWSFAASGKSE
jgi:hypothetical protein